MESASPGSQAFIDWYDSPKVPLRAQSKQLRSGVQLMKTRSAEEFSPHRFLNDTRSTSDLDSIWCTASPQENLVLSQVSDSVFISDDRVLSKSDMTTPHRSSRYSKLLSRKRPLRSKSIEQPKKQAECSEVGMSMEEGLAIGKASLAKLRQRLHSEDQSDVVGSPTNNITPLNKTRQFSPSASPISSLNTLKRRSETVLTPSCARSKQRFFTSTPKSSAAITTTPLKRFRTMDYSVPTKELANEKMKRTQSMTVTNEESDDDSFLDDVFVPFSHPDQVLQLLKQSSTQKR
ncbi:hypothetical protein RB195_015863 [Necator americanus]|uniref:Uncharacterized protein n=1 Tax=Necator americanus TaxID=51031 RepID=A0ABR1E6J7_NECAM